MNSIDCYSITSSAASTTNNLCLPENRIQFSKDQITVGGNCFKSASDALLVYLQQYDVFAKKKVKLNGHDSGKRGYDSIQLDRYLISSNQNLSAKSHAGRKHLNGQSRLNGIDAKENVESLLTSKISSPHLPVPETLRAVRLQHLHQQETLKPQNQTKTELQHEVEAALLRSAQLLEKVTKEDISSAKTVTSDINHVPKQVLGNDLRSSQDIPKTREKQSGHIYSYRTTRPQKSANNHSLSASNHAPVSYQKQSRELRRSASTDNLLSAPHRLSSRGRWSLSSSSTSLSNQSNHADIYKSVQSQSETPGVNNPSKMDDSGWVQQLDPCIGKSVPSWVGDLNPSEVSNSIWDSKCENDEKLYTMPGWAGKMDNSILSEDSVYFSEPKHLYPRMTPTKIKDKYPVTDSDVDNISSITLDSRPGLNVSDLAINNALSPRNNKQDTVINSIRKENSCLKKYQPKHSSPIQTNHTLPFSETVTTSHRNRMLDSEYTGEMLLHNCILPQTVKLKKSVDNLVASSAKLKHKSSDLSIASSSLQCSSIDTLSLLTGWPLLRKDVQEVTSIPTDHIVVSQSYSASPVINHQNRSSSPISIGQDQCYSDGLDGDRTWEMMAGTFKPPVPVDSEDLLDRNDITTKQNVERTLSGRKQPGSMETLKNMLFKLQAEESSTQDGSIKTEDSSSKNHSKSYTDIMPALQNYDFIKEPGGQSLERALVHLNRLKKLVQSTTPGSVDDTVKTAVTNEISERNLEQEDC